MARLQLQLWNRDITESKEVIARRYIAKLELEPLTRKVEPQQYCGGMFYFRKYHDDPIDNGYLEFKDVVKQR